MMPGPAATRNRTMHELCQKKGVERDEVVEIKERLLGRQLQRRITAPKKR